MAPPGRQATSLNKLMFGLLYFIALVGWHLLCSNHYDVHIQASVIRRANTVKPAADAGSLAIKMPRRAANNIDPIAAAGHAAGSS